VKLTMIVVMFGAAASMSELAGLQAYFRSLDAPPEAMFVGAGLLTLAAMLREARH
jgi:hypothetical protein